jgi:tRNA threonylcarbamoyladenosine biosynthesis protein TsaE
VRGRVSLSPEETEAAGEELGRTLVAGDVVALCGALGAGKTCFVRGVARALGVAGRPVSPTFTLINEYRGARPLYHVDAYRVDRLVDLLDLGLEEYFDGGGVTLVEWADKMRPLLPARAICVRIEGVGDEPRTITVRRPRS